MTRSQQILGAFDSPRNDVLVRRLPKRVFERARQVKGADTGLARECREAQIILDIGLNEFFQAPHFPARDLRF